MSFSVELLDDAGLGGLDPETVTRLCALAFAERGLDPETLGEVSVALVGEGEIQALNARFREKDAPTDVLSFEIDGPGGEMVGEIVICPACAEMDLKELVVHGALHLSGMDHGEDFSSSEMARSQSAVMERFRAGG